MSYHSLAELPIYELKEMKQQQQQQEEDQLAEETSDQESTEKTRGTSWIHWALFAQAFPTLLLSSVGFILTGLIVDIVQHWEVFIDLTELFIMIPVLLNLKGNLEMGLASRLSTAANSSNRREEQLSMSDPIIRGNILLVQFQALVAGLIVGLLSCFLGLLAHSKLNRLSEVLLIIACSAVTAFLSSAFTSVLLALIIVKCWQAKINPDNISTPLANCLGDLSTMCLLAMTAKLLHSLSSPVLLSGALILGSVLLTGLWAFLIYRTGEPQVRQLMLHGWTPVLSAILISSLAGLLFERFVRYFQGLGLILTVVNGVCGNAASIHAARLATSLHTKIDREEEEQPTERNRAAKRTLLFLCTPIQLLFLLLLHVTHLGHTSISLIYVLGHLLATNLHLLMILGWLAPSLVRALWRRRLDPDTYTMPLLAAFSDLSGTLIFVSMFSLLWLIGDRDANVGT